MVRRSSRTIPRLMSSAFGTLTNGFTFHMMIACTGGSVSVRISPSRLIFRVRGVDLQVDQARECGLVNHRVLPHANAASNSASAVLPCTDEGRKASDGPEEHSTVLMVLGTNECSNYGWPDRCVVTSESFDISDAETVIAAAHSGVRVATCVESSSKPRVCSLTHSSSTRSSRMMMCMTASINAMSVPGRGCKKCRHRRLQHRR